MSLDKLSNELLVEIALWLDSQLWTKQSLLNLALCSRRLNIIATPIIYSSFDDGCEEVLPVFLRTLLAKPELGLRVKSFSVTMVQAERSRAMVDIGQDFHRVTSAVERLSTLKSANNSMAWINCIHFGDWHALVALALFHLPNLKEIKLCRYDTENPYDQDLARGCLHSVPATLSFMGSTGAHLSFLESIEILADPLFGLNYPSVLPFFRLSSVKTVLFNGVIGVDFDDPLELFNTEELALHESCCYGESMIRFLGCFSQLKSFIYEHDASYQNIEFDAASLGKAIAHLKPSLEYLRINNVEVEDEDSSSDDRQFGLLGSLHEFLSLGILETDAGILLGSDHGNIALLEGALPGHTSRSTLYKLLPLSLQYLELTRCSTSIVEQLWDLVNWKQRTRSSLKTITVRWKEYPDLALLGAEARHCHEHESLIKAFSDAGVHMNLQLMVHEVTY
jgi:hypothetical protein